MLMEVVLGWYNLKELLGNFKTEGKRHKLLVEAWPVNRSNTKPSFQHFYGDDVNN